jgi:hypothetical protein
MERKRIRTIGGEAEFSRVDGHRKATVAGLALVRCRQNPCFRQRHGGFVYVYGRTHLKKHRSGILSRLERNRTADYAVGFASAADNADKNRMGSSFPSVSIRVIRGEPEFTGLMVIIRLRLQNGPWGAVYETPVFDSAAGGFVNVGGRTHLKKHRPGIFLSPFWMGGFDPG